VNGDFLDRLVARARGEVPALRPVILPGSTDQPALAEPSDRPSHRPRQAAQVKPTAQTKPTGLVSADNTTATSENMAAASTEATPASAVLLDPLSRRVPPEPVPLAPEAHAESPARRPPPASREFAVHQRRSAAPAELPAQESPSSREAPWSERESPPAEPVALRTGGTPLSDPASALVLIPVPSEAWRREIRPPQSPPPPQRPQSPPSPPQSATLPPLQRPQSPPPQRFPPPPQPPQGTTRMRRRRPRPAISLDDYLREREVRRG
jgi:hypothetical protein